VKFAVLISPRTGRRALTTLMSGSRLRVGVGAEARLAIGSRHEPQGDRSIDIRRLITAEAGPG